MRVRSTAWAAIAALVIAGALAPTAPLQEDARAGEVLCAQDQGGQDHLAVHEWGVAIVYEGPEGEAIETAAKPAFPLPDFVEDAGEFLKRRNFAFR